MKISRSKGGISTDSIKTWFITGASSGIGLEMSRQLLARGYNVIAVARRVPAIEHDCALCISADVTNDVAIREAVEAGIARFGQIHVLVNNAGKVGNVTLEEESLQNMKEFMELNFFGAFHTMQALLPHFRKNQCGTIINNSSQSGISPRVKGSAYCSSKFALEALTGVCRLETESFCRVMAFELGWFPETNIKASEVVQLSQIEEYKKFPPHPAQSDAPVSNDLTKAICAIIDQAECETMPRSLLLGYDCIRRARYEMMQMHDTIKCSMKYTKFCSRQTPTLVIFARKLKRLLTKIIKRFCN